MKYERSISVDGIPVSIGTAIPVEKFLGIETELNSSIDGGIYELGKYSDDDVLIISIYTIMRNIIESINTKDRLIAMNDTPYLLQALRLEVSTLEGSFTFSNRNLIIYFPRYDVSKLKDIYIPNKGNKFTVKELITQTIFNVVGLLENSDVTNVKILDKISSTDITLMLCHFMPDIITCSKLGITLLESHTARLKDPLKLNTKLPKSAHYDRDKLPFNELIVLLLGDGNVIMKTPTKNIRKDLGIIANRNNWTPRTTMKKVYNDLLKSPVKDYVKHIASYI